MRTTRLALGVFGVAALGLCLSGCNNQPSTTSAATARPEATAADIPALANQDKDPHPSSATPEEIQRRCGKASSISRRVTGAGSYEVDTVNLWYPRMPVEIITTITPNDPKPQMRTWVMVGGFKSRDENDDRRYTNRELGRRMPCLTEWTNADQKVRENMGLVD